MLQSNVSDVFRTCTVTVPLCSDMGSMNVGVCCAQLQAERKVDAIVIQELEAQVVALREAHL